MQEMGAINIYDIYVDVCMAARATKAGAALAAALGDHPASAAARLALHSSSSRAQGRASSSTGEGGRQLQGDKYDPCIDNEVETYLNLPEVQVRQPAGPWGRAGGCWLAVVAVFGMPRDAHATRTIWHATPWPGPCTL
jgi:hypothetical protein